MKHNNNVDITELTEIQSFEIHCLTDGLYHGWNLPESSLLLWLRFAAGLMFAQDECHHG